MPRDAQMALRVVRDLGLEHRCVVRAVDVPVAEVTGGSRHCSTCSWPGTAALAEAPR